MHAARNKLTQGLYFRAPWFQTDETDHKAKRFYAHLSQVYLLHPLLYYYCTIYTRCRPIVHTFYCTFILIEQQSGTAKAALCPKNS